MKSLLFLLPISLLCVQCSLFRKDDPKPKLPAATQEGKGTFECYVNGYPWVPSGRPGLFEPNLEVYYSPNFAGGSFGVRAHRVDVKEHGGYINISAANLAKEGTYVIDGDFTRVRYVGNSCDYWVTDADVTGTGTLTITRLDLQAGVIAGRFEFTVAKPGCDTVRVTEGRFDMPL